MGTMTYFSNRIYKDTLAMEDVRATTHALFLFNRAKQFAFSTATKEKRSGHSRRTKSMHLTVKERFGLDDYYANSAVREANAKRKSLDELQKLYLKNTEAQIQSVKKKLKTEKGRFTQYKKIKQSFVKGKPTFPKNLRLQQKGNYFVVSFSKRSDIYYHAYQLEHEYIDTELQKRQTKIGFLTGKLHCLEERYHALQTEIASCVFGTKKFFSSQYTLDKYIQNHVLWQKEWEQSRYRTMALSGRKDSAHGNFVFHYESATQALRYQTPSGKNVEISYVLFPYGQEAVEHAIRTQENCKDKKKAGKPMAWAIEDHGAYYLFKCMFEVVQQETVNYSKVDGVLGVDCNVDHFAVSNINAKGQLVSSCSLPFDLAGKTSQQINKIIEAEAIGLVEMAVQANKPLVIEKLNTTTSKASHAYGNKKANLRMSLFAYRKMTTAIQARAEKRGVAVFEVNPAYTSQIGKMKYMKRFGISIHESASFVIARRALGYKEKLPPVLAALLPEKIVGRHHWAQWAYVTKLLKGIRTHAYYRSALFDVDKFHVTHELFVPEALTELERNGLSPLKSRKPLSSLNERRSCAMGTCLV